MGNKTVTRTHTVMRFFDNHSVMNSSLSISESFF